MIVFYWESVKGTCCRLRHGACPSVETVNRRAGPAVICAAVTVGLVGCGIGSIDGTPVTAEFVQPPAQLDVSPACANAPVTVEQFIGSWMTGSSGVVGFGRDGSAVVQERAVGRRGTWSYQPRVPGGPCLLRMRWTVGFVAGRSDIPIEPPSEWVLQPVSVTPTAFTLKSVDKAGEPDTHWWRGK